METSHAVVAWTTVLCSVISDACGVRVKHTFAKVYRSKKARFSYAGLVTNPGFETPPSYSQLILFAKALQKSGKDYKECSVLKIS